MKLKNIRIRGLREGIKAVAEEAKKVARGMICADQPQAQPEQEMVEESVETLVEKTAKKSM